MTRPLFLIPSLVLASVSPGHSAIIYTTGITGNPGDFTVSADSNVSEVNWYAVAGRGDYHAAANLEATNRRVGMFNGNDGSNTLNDYLFFQNRNATTSNMDYFAHTSTGSTFLAFSPQNYSSLTANWLVNRDAFASGGGYYVAIQVAGAWYSSTTNVADSPTTAETGSDSFNFLTSQWVTVNEVVGTSLGRGATTFSYNDLFSTDQQITGIGFYVNGLAAGGASSNRTLRIDNFVIEGVPEPTTALTGILGAGLLVLRRRR